jgi:hypothetical protein
MTSRLYFPNMACTYSFVSCQGTFFYRYIPGREEFEDTKGVIRIRISKKIQHNGQKKRYKGKNKDLQNIHIKLKIE